MENTDTQQAAQPPATTAGASHHPVYQQCLRILRCTARAMASSPGGLRFKAGTHPWLEGLENITRGRGTQALPTIGDAA
ncbi:MAG: hypothetical protein V4451_08345 [Pseudomonadota bacterium]